jgi:hypothetical membrane protein
LLALGGIVGPAAFIATWAVAGASTHGYSPVHDAISELAAIGAPTRAAMSTAFVVDGVGLIAFGIALREAIDGSAWIACIATGASTLAVAAVPLHDSRDHVHVVFAGVGYASLVAVPLLAARATAVRGRRGWAPVSVMLSAVAAASLIVSAFAGPEGLWQRIGLTIGDAWIIAAATRVAFRREPAT